MNVGAGAVVHHIPQMGFIQRWCYWQSGHSLMALLGRELDSVLYATLPIITDNSSLPLSSTRVNIDNNMLTFTLVFVLPLHCHRLPYVLRLLLAVRQQSSKVGPPRVRTVQGVQHVGKS